LFALPEFWYIVMHGTKIVKYEYLLPKTYRTLPGKEDVVSGRSTSRFHASFFTTLQNFSTSRCASNNYYYYIDRDWLRVGRTRDRIPVGAKFSAPVQTSPGAHPASCTMGTGSFQGVEAAGAWGWPPTPSSAEGPRKSGAIPLLTLRASVAYEKDETLLYQKGGGWWRDKFSGHAGWQSPWGKKWAAKWMTLSDKTWFFAPKNIFVDCCAK